MTRPGKLISGGQTGADQAALRAARALGIPLGGWVPRDYLTELGQARWLKTHYPELREHTSSYMTPRTMANLMAADATVVFGDLGSQGSKYLLKTIRLAHKPILANPGHVTLRLWVDDLTAGFGRPLTINVAGNRASHNPRLEAWVFAVLVHAWDETGLVATPVDQVPTLRNAAGAAVDVPDGYLASIDRRLGGQSQ